MSDEERARSLFGRIRFGEPDEWSLTPPIREIIAAFRAGRDEEWEACCKDVCEMCRDEVPGQFAFMPIGRERLQVWTHFVGTANPWTVCKAAAIRGRGE